jgi:hypothetical protein
MNKGDDDNMKRDRKRWGDVSKLKETNNEKKEKSKDGIGDKELGM